jgi:MoaF N-terminal domain
MRWTWTEGPTKGQTHEHRFHQDGTVEWRTVGGESERPGASKQAPSPPERPRYEAFEVTPTVYAVSYLAPSGFTLTVVLNFANRELVGFASGQDQWHPLRGRFEVVG